jgi:hypothetical protein
MKAKTHLEISLGKPGRPDQTRVRPAQFFLILTIIKRRRFDILKGQNAENYKEIQFKHINIYLLIP